MRRALAVVPTATLVHVTLLPTLLGGCVSAPSARVVELGEAHGGGAGAAEVSGGEPDAEGWGRPEWRVIGRSVEGRAIEAGTFGAGRLRVYLIGLIHGDEPEGFARFDELLDGVGRDGDVGRVATVRVVSNMNPDGRAMGTRGNARGVDLNRNWPTENFDASARHGEAALSEPETVAVQRDLDRFGPDLIVVLHSTRRGPFVNFDGPGRAAAEAFAEAASRVSDGDGTGEGWRVEPSMGYETPGSLGTWAGVERGIPILTVEYRRGQDAGLALREGVAGVVAAVEAMAGGTR